MSTERTAKQPDSIQQALEQALLALEQVATDRLADARDRALVVDPDLSSIRAHLNTVYDFAEPIDTPALVTDVIDMLRRWDLDSTHPRCFGLFNPPALPVTAVADALVAMLNPQVGTRTHAPAANEIERHVLAFLARRIGFAADTSEAHFTSGGQEANATALAIALSQAFPMVTTEGLRSLVGQPCLYVSEHAHHSLLKASRASGLGAHAVHEIGTDTKGRMQVLELQARLAADRANGDLPFMLVATAGTTGIGSVDPLVELAHVCARENLWLHVDAAWAGSALLSENLSRHLRGIEHADSVTWDAHKWLDVPMGAGMLFLRQRGLGNAVYAVATGYVPDASDGSSEPYLNTAQWSRRFIGLKLFMALASLSERGYSELIEHQAELGDTLRAKLRDAGWAISNDSPFPLVCFSAPGLADNPGMLDALVKMLQERGQVWISKLDLPAGETVLRACITSYDTREEDLDVLVDELELCRAKLNLKA